MNMRNAFLYTFAIAMLAGVTLIAENVRVTSASAQQLVFEFKPEWQTRQVTGQSGALQEITFAGAAITGEIGAPQIPVEVVSVGLPENGSASVTILQADFDLLNNVRLAPQPRTVRSETGYDLLYEAADSLYATNQFSPNELVQVEEPKTFRAQRIANIVIQPLVYNPVSRQVRLYKNIVVQVNFSGDVTAKQPAMRQDVDEGMYKFLLNYDQAKGWRQPATNPFLRKVQRSNFQGDNWFKIKINGNGAGGKEGMYKITGAVLNEVLAKNNLSISAVDPSTLQIFNNGGIELPFDVQAKNDTLVENPILVVGGDDGSFGANDYLLFYGRSLEGVVADPVRNELRHYINHYSYDNVYWLTFNRARGKRIQAFPTVATIGLTEEPYFPDLAWLEEERYNIYKSGTTWLGRELRRDDNAYSVTFNLPGAAPEAEVFLRTAIASLSSGTHYFSVYVNGNNLGQFNQYGTSSGFALIERAFNSQGVLLDGDNTVTINYNVATDNAFSYVDFIELQYARRFNAVNDQLAFFSPLKSGNVRYRITGFSRNDVGVYDVTDIADIRVINSISVNNGVVDFAVENNAFFSRRYVAATPAALKNIDAGAISAERIAGLRKPLDVDYIVITANDFRQQAEQLESLRENWSPKEKFNTEVVNISDVINEFGWGRPEPAAIRNFLGYAYDNWGQPGYVLLFGDGHFDYKNILKNNVPNLVIPYETDGNNENNTRVTDDWFTYINGDQNGQQIAIGRMVVQTVDEAQNVVQKIIDYETAPEYGEWLKTVTIVADDEFTNDSNSESIHTRDAERLAEQHVPRSLDVKKIYLINYPEVRTASITGREKPAATLDLLEQINNGSLIINWIGHGNPDLWAHERVLLNTRDFDKMENGRRMALWIAATCEFAYWDQPTSQSFGEDILNAAGRGAVAMLSSARLAYANDNAAFNVDFYDQLFSDYETTGIIMRLGDALMNAKRSVYSNRINNEKYNLFGDPAMRLCAPRYRAVIDDIDPDSIQALSKMTIRGHVEDQGAALNGYNGKILVRALDTRKRYNYDNAGGTSPINGLYASGNTIFRGVAPIKDGAFDVQFIVPKDISYGGREGGFSVYFWNDNSSGTGNMRGLAVGGTAVNLVDKDGPQMHIKFGEGDFVPGDYVSTRPTLHLTIADSVSGVNTAGDVGHQILLTLDEDYNNSLDITEYFTYNEGSYTDGTLNYTILDLPLGQHTVQVKAWDNSNNSSIVESNFIVIDDSDLEIRNPLTYPNPMRDTCSFRYELSQDADVTIKIYTVAGRLIKKFEATPGQVGYNIYASSWDGRDESGDAVANGVYLYKISARSTRGEETLTAEALQKLIIAR